MSKQQFFRQCVLVQKSLSVSHETVGWINEDSAKVGARLQIQENPDIDSETVWIVKSVGSARIPDREAKDLERQFAKHRKATDI